MPDAYKWGRHGQVLPMAHTATAMNGRMRTNARLPGHFMRAPR